MGDVSGIFWVNNYLRGIQDLHLLVHQFLNWYYHYYLQLPLFRVSSSFWYVHYSSCLLCPRSDTSLCECRCPGTWCIYPIWSWFSLQPQVHCLAFCRTSVHPGHRWCLGSCFVPFCNVKFCLFIIDDYNKVFKFTPYLKFNTFFFICILSQMRTKRLQIVIFQNYCCLKCYFRLQIVIQIVTGVNVNKNCRVICLSTNGSKMWK